MRMRDCRPTDEVFTHIDSVSMVARHINASAMLRDAPRRIKEGKAQVITAEFDALFIQFIREHRGLEQGKLDRLVEPFLSIPILGFWMDDDTMLTVDGHHRLVRLFDAGEEYYTAVVFDNDLLGPYCIEDMPSDLSDALVEDTLLLQAISE